MLSNETPIHYTFVDDRLKNLFREEVMNTHQLVLPTITIIVANVFELGIQAMNLSIGYTIIPIDY